MLLWGFLLIPLVYSIQPTNNATNSSCLWNSDDIDLGDYLSLLLAENKSLPVPHVSNPRVETVEMVLATLPMCTFATVSMYENDYVIINTFADSDDLYTYLVYLHELDVLRYGNHSRNNSDILSQNVEEILLTLIKQHRNGEDVRFEMCDIADQLGYHGFQMFVCNGLNGWADTAKKHPPR